MKEIRSKIKIEYRFSAKVWQYTGTAGWHFASLPQRLSREIRKTFQEDEAGWGRLKATAQIKNSTWETAIWFDTKLNTYLLPLKAEIRKKENIVADKLVRITIAI